MQQPSTRTLYSYWNDIRGARSAPDRRDVDPSRIRDALSNTFILQSEDGIDFSFRLAGSHLCAGYCRELKGRGFSTLWGSRDQDAMDTLIRAVTEDHAVALVTFEALTDREETLGFEMILLPLRHNGVTTARIIGAMAAVEIPYWLGIHPLITQRITGLRLIWPDDHAGTGQRGFSASIGQDFEIGGYAAAASFEHGPATATRRRYAHLAVIDGGKS